MASSSDYDEHSSVGSSYDSEDDEFQIQSHKRRRKGNGKERNIYGVFYDEYDDNDNARSRDDKASRHQKLSEPLQFISESSQKVEEDQISSQGSVSDGDNDDEGKAGDTTFLELLEQATKKNRTSFIESESSRIKDKVDEAKVDLVGTKTPNAANTRSESEPLIMGAGLGFNSHHDETDDVKVDENDYSSSMGLDFASNAGLGFMNSNTMEEKSFTQRRTKPTDPNLAQWEKHTKGIGMKLLSKMGFKAGEGLGSGKNGRKGISKVIEVVVRPNNLGLGFGNFKEASQLKANKQLENELHGNSADVANEVPIKNKTSAAEILVQEGNWRKRSTSLKPKRRKKVPRNEFSRQNDKSEVIIDMRGPSSTQISIDKRNLLGSEFLEATSLLTSTAEAKFQTTKLLLSSVTSKVTTIKEDIADLQSKVDLLERRRICLINIERDLKSVYDSVAATISSGNVCSESCKQEIIKFLSLKERFPDEYKSLSLSKIAPTMLGPLYREFLSKWNPIEYPEVISDVVYEWRKILPEDNVFSAIYINYLLPRIRYAILSLWDVKSPSSCIVMFRTLSATFTSRKDAEDIDEIIDQRQYITALQNIQENLILPKLRAYLSDWNPLSSSEEGHKVILPWKPYLEASLFHLILKDAKKKIRTSLSSKWDVSNTSFLTTIIPWKNEFEKGSFDRTVVEVLIPRLARYFSTLKLSVSTIMQSVKLLDDWNKSMEIPRENLKSIIEGEFLPNWISTIYQLLSTNKRGDFNDAIKIYSVMKSSLEKEILNDKIVCAYFYVSLLMIKARIANEVISINILPERNRISYRSVLRRRMKELSVQNRTQASIPTSAPTANTFNGFVPGVTKPFREAVEDVLNENNLLLQPRLGAHAKKDGKQVYECGMRRIPVLFDQNIIYAFQDKEWRPLPIDSLISIAKQAS